MEGQGIARFGEQSGLSQLPARRQLPASGITHHWTEQRGIAVCRSIERLPVLYRQLLHRTISYHCTGRIPLAGKAAFSKRHNNMQLGEFHKQDVQVALAAVLVNVLVASVAWTYRAYWLLQVERFVDVVQGQAARRKNNSFLRDNFGPVDKEVQANDLPVEGQLPKALNGVFARTGPNPALPINGDYHWFDGDACGPLCCGAPLLPNTSLAR